MARKLAEAPTSAAKAPKAAVSERPQNLKGGVLILEYHHLGTSKNTMFRSKDQFQHDLERLYDMGFRPVSMSSYLVNKMDLAPGASPVVFTFDDSNPDQVRLDDKGQLTSGCFLGVWQQFSAKHPDFPIIATFFVLPSLWEQPKQLKEKLALLKSLNCEIGNHTITHRALRTLKDKQVEQEIAEGELLLQKIGEPTPSVFALPYGSTPKNQSILKGFEYKGQHIAPRAVMLVGANPAPPADSPKFNPLRIPRVQACEGPYGLTYWLDLIEKGHTKVYVAGKGS